MKRTFLIISFFYAFIFHFKAQNKQQKWVAGISLAGAKYTYNSRPLVYVSPRLNISRYIFKGLILDASGPSAATSSASSIIPTSIKKNNLT